MIKKTTIIGFALLLLITACSSPSPTPQDQSGLAPLPTEGAAVVPATEHRTETPMAETPSPTETTADPVPSIKPTDPPPTIEAVPSNTPVEVSDDPGPPIFPAAISGEEGGMYLPSDISVIAGTGRVQFLNIYANW